MFYETEAASKAVMPDRGGPGGPLAPPIFGRSVNPIPTGGGQIMPTITTGPPKVFHLPASLMGTNRYSHFGERLLLTKTLFENTLFSIPFISFNPIYCSKITATK